MKDLNTTWTRDELKAYILIYCANANFIESKKEIAYIKKTIQEQKFEEIHEEFEKDNDYQSLQKIKLTLERFNYSHEEVELLLEEMKELFLKDGGFDTLERNLFLGIKHLVN